jgi:hypothetical protein
MVRGSDSLVERFFELSTGMRVSEWKVEVGVMGHTLGTNVVVQPFCRKSPWVQTVLKAVDDERLASDNDMEKDELLKGGDTLLVNLVDRDAIDKGEVWRRFYKAVDVEVGRDRLEGRARSLCGHFWSVVCGAHCGKVGMTCATLGRVECACQALRRRRARGGQERLSEGDLAT